MKKKLSRQGFNCFTPKLKPIDGRYGIDDQAVKLRDKINIELGETSKFILIGFSMGGIICRYYLQELGGINRVEKFISISTPHHGTYTAYLYPGIGTKQLRPKSNFLENLKLKENFFNSIKTYSFRTPFDLMIIPSKSSEWEIAENRKYFSPIHSLMLFNPKLLGNILSILKEK